MAENRQPFTEYATRTNRRYGAARWAWMVAGVLAVLLVVSLLMWASAVGKVRGLQSLQGKLDDAHASLAAAREENQTNQDLITALQSRITDLQ